MRVAADGGVALAEYAAGKASDHPIARLILTKENTAKAASAAKGMRELAIIVIAVVVLSATVRGCKSVG